MSIEERALDLLGAGVASVQVAQALGVSESRISQLLSDENFAQQVSSKKIETLTAHTRRDNKYDQLEDALLEKLEKSLPLLMRPDAVMKALKLVNEAKRRGSSANDAINTNNTQIVNLIMPAKVVQKFSTNSQNQVIKAGQQELLTIQSTKLLNKVERKEVTYVPDTPTTDLE